jgi:ABC-2 type transport system permease protein
MKQYLSLTKKMVGLRISEYFAHRFGAFSSIIAHIIDSMIQVLLMFFIYNVSNGLPGWTFYELIIFNGTAILAWGLSSSFFFPMVWFFGWRIDQGEFDLTLLKPIKTIPYMIISSVNPHGFTEIITGSIILVIGLLYSGIQITIQGIMGYFYLIILACLVFYGIAALIIGLSFKYFKVYNFLDLFWELSNLSNYPLNIYKLFVPFFLTFIFPLALANFYPASFLLGKITDLSILITLTAISVGFTVIGTLTIKYGLKHYSSAGG